MNRRFLAAVQIVLLVLLVIVQACGKKAPPEPIEKTPQMTQRVER